MKGVSNILSNDATVSGLVGNRIYANTRLQGDVLPAITLQSTNTEPYATKSGVSTLDDITIQVISYSDSLYESDGAITLSQAVRSALDRVARGTYNGETIQSINFLDDFNDFEEIKNKKIHYVEQNYQVRVER